MSYFDKLCEFAEECLIFAKETPEHEMLFRHQALGAFEFAWENRLVDNAKEVTEKWEDFRNKFIAINGN